MNCGLKIHVAILNTPIRNELRVFTVVKLNFSNILNVEKNVVQITFRTASYRGGFNYEPQFMRKSKNKETIKSVIEGPELHMFLA